MIHRRQRSAIILAAGHSRRMQRFKPLLPLGGRTVLDRVISIYRNAGVTDLRVVTGFRSEAIRSALSSLPVSVVHNPAHDAGMFSSVQAGINTLPTDTASFFVHPVDIPLVRPHTLVMLMEAFDAHSSPVAYPVFDNTRGHPPLIGAALKDTLLSHGDSGGLSALLHRFDATALDVQVADEGVLLDIDTPDDFRRLAIRVTTSDRLTGYECRVLMERVRKLPRPLIDHCHRVACVAVALAEAVNSSGGGVDVALIESAAWVHDVARLEKNHADAGAHLLHTMGFPAMAALVAVHMDLSVSPDTPLDEAQIVYLADKLVAKTTVVGLAQRFDAKLKKQDQDPTVSANILQRRRAALIIQSKVEQTCGETTHQILNRSGIVNGRPP
jgi:CTP:molybdopterin cytidylyltransferase MocA/HD superfamily phosphohydrolase YqeK